MSCKAGTWGDAGATIRDAVVVPFCVADLILNQACASEAATSALSSAPYPVERNILC